MIEFQDTRRNAIDIDVTQKVYIATIEEKMTDATLQRGLRYFRPRNYMDITDVAAFMNNNLIRSIDGKIPE